MSDEEQAILDKGIFAYETDVCNYTLFMVYECGVKIIKTNDVIQSVLDTDKEMRNEFCEHELITWFTLREEHGSINITYVGNCAFGV